jgi:hypothetical protein
LCQLCFSGLILMRGKNEDYFHLGFSPTPITTSRTFKKMAPSSLRCRQVIVRMRVGAPLGRQNFLVICPPYLFILTSINFFLWLYLVNIYYMLI